MGGVLLQLDKKGLSVLRQNASDHEFEITFDLLKEASRKRDKDRFWHSVATMPAGDVREKDGEKIAAVYDTSVKDRRHHADIMGVSTDRKQKERHKKAILDIMNLSISSTAEFRGGVFAHHARSA
ncbi:MULTISPECIES: hypothetical protein [unclassified Methylobacterium]|uniref:hypothetical protein n=1 Tax=unclassified Methylobacterium TaxID=2615210 RepID=UPI0011C1E3EB|nr:MULTISPECIES: hypothetical protein [unclassified Methylobacterium]QEE40706.1 hypothetical protein FVA80_18625 [Methylobacterium sp. WL1]TXN55842.1 hypothetical protein FV241_18025 [Methylobacterium sp. WL2]